MTCLVYIEDATHTFCSLCTCCVALICLCLLILDTCDKFHFCSPSFVAVEFSCVR